MWADPSWEAIARSWAGKVTCRECGTESAGATGGCARCGAPLGLQQPVAPPTPAGWQAPAQAGWPGNPVPPLPWNPLFGAPGQPASPGNSRRLSLIVAGAGGALLLALIALGAFIGVRSAATPTAATPTAATPTASASAATQLTWDELGPGDCLAGSDMGLGNSKPWPDLVTRVACTQRHEAEVFFAGNIWPLSLAYPGKSAIDNHAWTRCNTTFTGYDGIAAAFEGNDTPNSAFTFTDIANDDSSDWAAGTRRLVCVAYKPNFADTASGAMPVAYSIKGTKK